MRRWWGWWVRGQDSGRLARRSAELQRHSERLRGQLIGMVGELDDWVEELRQEVRVQAHHDSRDGDEPPGVVQT